MKYNITIPTGYDASEVSDWCEDQDVIASGLSKDDGCFYVVTRDPVLSHLNYRLLRFFTLNGKTVCSVDMQDEEREAFIIQLLDKFVIADLEEPEENLDYEPESVEEN